MTLYVIAFLFIALAATFISPYVRFLFIKEEKGEVGNLPPISIVMLSDRDAQKLEHRLEAVLSQKYEKDFEAIVVTEKGESEVQDVLKRHQDDPHLHSTFVPLTSRYMSRQKLAVTLGVKAAKHEWIILLDANTVPVNSTWLHTMACHMWETKNMVVSYSNYKPEESKLHQRFERLFLSLYLLTKAARGRAYRINGTNFAFRKSDFIAKDGYRGNLHFVHGEFDFIINKYARKRNTSVVLQPEGWASVAAPYRKQWRDDHLSHLYLRSSLRGSLHMNLLKSIDQLALHGGLWGLIGCLLYGVLKSDILMLITSALLLIIFTAFRLWFAYKTVKRFDAHIPLWAIPFLSLSMIGRWAYWRIRLLFADKIDFSSHKL